MGGDGHTHHYTLMNSEKVSTILQQMNDLLRRSGNTGQADFVSSIRTLLDTDSPDVTSHLTSVDMWGGSGAVWEVGYFESPDDKRAFWQLVVDLAHEMRSAGIQHERSLFVADTLSEWLASGV